jgi:hypothetical protein
MSHSHSFKAWQHAQRAADEAGYRFHLQACGAPAQIACQAERDEMNRLNALASSLLRVFLAEIEDRGTRVFLQDAATGRNCSSK